ECAEGRIRGVQIVGHTLLRHGSDELHVREFSGGRLSFRLLPAVAVPDEHQADVGQVADQLSGVQDGTQIVRVPEGARVRYHEAALEAQRASELVAILSGSENRRVDAVRNQADSARGDPVSLNERDESRRINDDQLRLPQQGSLPSTDQGNEDAT